MKILFLHGPGSAPGGVWPAYLATHGHEVICPELSDDDFEGAVRTAQAALDEHRPDVVVGNSRGGAVALNIDSGEATLVLLCPEWKKYGTATTVKADAVILHSRADDVVPFADSEELVRNSRLLAWTLIDVGTDHRLNDAEVLETLLEACRLGHEDEAGDEEAEDILEQDWTGLCYTAALRWVSEAEDEDWVVVHGTICGGPGGRRIAHAWCERGPWVVDLARPLGARIVEREQYYRLAQPEVHKAYPSDEARLLAARNRHNGPWDEREQLPK